MLINKPETTRLKRLNDSKTFTEFLNDMDDIYENIEEYSLNKKCKILIVFDGMLSNIKRNPIVSELFIRDRRLKVSLFLWHKLILLHQKTLD